MVFFTMYLPSPKANMTMETQPFEDVSPIKHGDFPLSCYFLGGIHS